MEELECTPLLDGVRKILARSTGGSQDSEFGGVVLRQVPVAQRVVPQEDIRGEVMDFVVQQIEDTDLSPSYVWAIASKVANKISEAIPSNIQINALNDVAKRELDGLCAKIEADPSILEVRPSSSSISVKALRNARRTMEDRHVIILNLNLVAGLEPTPQYEYFAVFDGHGGRDAANYCAAHFHLVLAEQLRSGLEVPAAIVKAFKIVDGNFCDRAVEMARKAGSTAVVALIVDKKTLHVGWLGDSEAVLARNGQAQGLVKPHKPSVVSEQERIERLGGEVINLMGVHRVNANLAVSRAVGDMEHKPFVSNDAEVTSVEIDDSCDFIVLGCDGLFDLLSYQDVVVNAYHSALSRRFDNSVAENLTRAAISNGSTDNVTTIVVNLRDPKKWHFESVVFPKPEAAERAASAASRNPNGPSETAAPNVPLAGGDSSPVREVAAGFVSDTVEMALSKVNGAPPSNLDLACDLSPPEEEQRDLMASLKNDTPEADRLNPDAPEFVPSFSTASTAPELPNQSSSEENTEATVITASPATETMPKSESRDELVYEIDREIGTAPQAVQAELVNLDVSSAVSVPPPKAAEGLSDSDEDLNSMVVHEDQPQPEIKLSELIVREQHIHVIPEESPTDEVSSPVPEAIAHLEPTPELGVTQNGSTNVDQLVDLQEETKSQPPEPKHNATEDTPDALQASAADDVEKVVDLVSGSDGALGESVQNVVESSQVSEDLVDLASQVLRGDVLEQIEQSDPWKPAHKSPASEAPVRVEDSQYLFSAEVGVHEEDIVPRAQPLLFETEDNKADNALSDAMNSMLLDEAPKIVDAIEKLTEPKLENSVPEQIPDAVLEPKAEEPFDFGSANIELDSVKDVVEKLSAANELREETVAAPIIPDSVPEAEGVQDEDSESDNDAQEWSFVKPADQQGPPPESKEAPSETTAAAAAVAAVTSLAAAAATTTALTGTATPKAAERTKAAAKGVVKGTSASKPSPRTPTSAAAAKTTPSSKASPKTTTNPKPTTKATSVTPTKPAAARAPVGGAKTAAAAKPAATKPATAAPKAAPARQATATKTTAPIAPKTSSAATKAPTAPKAAASKPAAPKPASSTAAKPAAALSTRPAASARAPAISAASKAPASSAAPKAPAARSVATKAPAPKPAVKPVVSNTISSKTSATATTKSAASAVRAAAPKPAAASAGVKKVAATNSTAASTTAPSAARVAAARVAAARTAPKTGSGTASTTSTAKPKTGAVKTTSTTGKVDPKSPVKKAVKQEKKADQAPAAAPEDVPKENGGANIVSQTNGHSSPHQENGSSESSGPAHAEAPTTTEGQGDILV